MPTGITCTPHGSPQPCLPKQGLCAAGYFGGYICVLYPGLCLAAIIGTQGQYLSLLRCVTRD